MGKYSVCDVFDDDSGNIRLDRTEHTWKDGKCTFCGANQENYDRGEELETHAYQFIHTEKPEEIFKMKFDVIVGNPPYQMSDGGGANSSSAMPLYHRFIQQSKKLSPRYLTMIIPSRWFSGGRGLDDFRNEMLHDKRLCIIHDFPISRDCFQGVDIAGGVCFFLWDRDHEGLCNVYTHTGNKISSQTERPLLEDGCETFIRYNEAISVLRKVMNKRERSFRHIVGSYDPFGFDLGSNYKGSERRLSNFVTKKFQNSTVIYYRDWYKKGIAYIDEKAIKENKDYVDKYKVYISLVSSGGLLTQVLGKPFVGEPNSCCTNTYLLIGPFENKEISKNVVNYIKTKFFRFLVGLIKNTPNGAKKCYSFVPMQNFYEPWTDEKLYAKYGLTQEEIAFIESMVRPMEVE
jgi:site-specific DNA-methyltransferase (adenine-specific)